MKYPENAKIIIFCIKNNHNRLVETIFKTVAKF
ncbi:hypothetical protein ABID16_003571 [Rhizobium aquaticum]|uniref:Uncharacterized protein n=1 Tax=Rhizobium aquaticum TaxID=1549636 RepID=A0ABV2J3M8_9HYPH